MIKLLYAPLECPKINSDIHQGERLCGGLLLSVPLVSEKNSCRKFGNSLLYALVQGGGHYINEGVE